MAGLQGKLDVRIEDLSPDYAIAGVHAQTSLNRGCTAHSTPSAEDDDGLFNPGAV